ncbi:MAG TPA: MG2 domain-containing protein [Bryobacteraceae bacterium]|nr:MG2 domain-containing protein [Bryobacteraceae bacterium]
MNRRRFARAVRLNLLRAVFLALIAAPIIGQYENQPYFSLSSNRTFGGHESPTIQLSGYGIEAVRIRVYRVNDAVQFMRQMEDPHTFNSRYPRPHGKLTLLERIHNWKRGLRRDIRVELRGQFTESPRRHLGSLFHHQQPTKVNATYFADAPVLNPDQLVLSFLQTLPGQTWKVAQVPIPVKNKGVFLVEAVHANLRAYTILAVSDIVLVTKTGRDHILHFVADRETGEPVAGARISTMTRNENPSTIETDADGVAIKALDKNVRPASDLRVVAQHGPDVAFGDLGEWNFSQRERNLAGLVYTDRPVYRPGDTMHFRGILREQHGLGYAVPAGQTFSVEVMDPDGKAIFQKSLTANSNGILHDELPLPRNAALGNYFVQVRSGENLIAGNFEVQEYKKPEYEVRVLPEKSRVLEGDSVKTTIDARYYFGEPVNGANVKYSIYRTRYWAPFWYDAEEGQSEEYDGGPGMAYDNPAGEQISQGTGQLDSDGKLTIDVPTTVSNDKTDYQYRIEAGVTDQAGREISGTGRLIATYGSFLLNIQPDRWFYEPGSSASFKIQARDYDNKPVSAAVHVEIASWYWRTRKAGQPEAQTNVKTGADGVATAELQIPAEGGTYRVLATAPTPEGRVVQQVEYLWVAGSNWNAFWGEGRQSVQIVPDKTSYKPGDSAKILIVAGQDHTPVLVTVEGRDIRSHQLVRSKGPTAVFQYTVTRDDEPGFFVSAQFLRNGKMYQSQKRINVPPDDHRLCITLATDKPQYQPGQTATYNIEAKSMDGKPVRGADFSLGVVDEAIYAIRRDTTPDPLNTFYGRSWNSVYTENSLTYFFTGDAGTRRMRLAQVRSEAYLAQLKPDRLVQPKIRKVFPDTAFWAADITTDDNGRAQAHVTFPDSVTTWRATVRGASPDDRFGSGVLKTIVRKNLIVRLAVPRFFVQGDEVVISALVHNYLQTDKQARVAVNLTGLDLLSGTPRQDVEAPSKSEVKVSWRVKAEQVRQAKITAEALTNEESDALEVDLPVNPPGVPVHQAESGSLSDSASAHFSLTFPATAVPGSRSLSIRLASSVTGTLFGALQYLTSFPYGCVEQTMSSFLPDLMVDKAVQELGLKQPIDQADLDRKIQTGLDRLYNFQHDDGGWGWWQSDESHPFMTAYVVAGLSDARTAGISVRPEALTRGIAWMQQYLAQNRDAAADLRAYMNFALAQAGAADKSSLNDTYASRSDLSPYGTALLGLALEKVKDHRATELADRLEHSVRQDAQEAWWPATRDAMLDFEADVTPESTAYAVKFLSHAAPNSTLLPKAALWLVNHRNEGYWWSSTKQTAMVIYGLLDYLKTTGELHPDLSATVLVNGKPAASQSFTSDSGLADPEFVLDESKLQPGANQIQIATSGKGRLYYSVSANSSSNEAKFEKNGAISLNLLRDYYRLSPTHDGERIVYDLTPLNGPVSQGDLIAVRLTVTGSDWRYLLVEDPIPAGTEFVEHDNLYELRDKPPWWAYWFTRREMHDDRMAIFQKFFHEGQQQYFYLLKVVNPGVFQVSPARVQPMYQPQHQATTEARTLEIR